MRTELGAVLSANCRVMVVDDDPFTCNMIARGLEKLGIADLQTASSGHEARQLFDGQRPVDLLFCDLSMPGEDGITLVRKLAMEHANCGVVLISSISEKLLRVVGELVSAHGLWLIGTLAKPVGTSELRHILGAWQSGRDTPRPVQPPELSVEQFRTAIRQGEIEVFVQPQCATDTGELVGVEALSRWHSPTAGPIFPDTFIPFATTHGLINELTEFVIRRSLDALAAWDEQGIYLTASVNIAPESLQRVDLPDFIHTECTRRNLDAKRLVLELTEANIIEDLPRSLDVVSRLYLAGVVLSLDDFGTGHATLSQLHQLPFSEIKLDRSFVGAMTDDAEARSIVESSCELAERLKLRCIAEGVEDMDALKLLSSLHCSAVQGYLIARPMPIETFAEWAQSQVWKAHFSGTTPTTC